MNIKNLFAFALIVALMIGAFMGCKDKPNEETQPEERIAVNLRANVSTLKVADGLWSPTDRVGLFMKRANETLGTGTVFADANNVQMSIVGQTLTSVLPVRYPEIGNVDFISYYPYTTPLGTGFTLPVDIANGDVLYSNNAINRAPTTDAVTLNFEYALAKIVLTIVGGDNSPLALEDFVGMTASIKGMYTQATLQLATGSFTAHAAKEPIAMSRIATTGASVTFEALVLPTVVAAGDVTFVFNIAGEEYTYAPAGNYEWATLYEIELKLNYPVPRTLTLLNANITPRNSSQRNFEMSMPNKSEKDVYVAGYGYGGVAVLWKNGDRQNLTVGTLREARANSVYVSGSDVYVAGFDSNVQNMEFAVLWKNGVAQNLTDGTGRSEARSVYVSGSDVYVAGWEWNTQESRAVLWKNGVKQNLTDGTLRAARANSVYVSGSDVYVAGWEHHNSQGWGDAVIWKNGIKQNLTGGTKYWVEPYSVHVSGSDVYVAGYERDEQGFYFAILWKNGVRQNLTDGTRTAEANYVYVSGSDVYVAGYETNTRQVAVLWKNGVRQNLTDGTRTSAAQSVYVSGSDVYVAGREVNGTRQVAVLWKNGVGQNLSDGSTNVYANSVFVK